MNHHWQSQRAGNRLRAAQRLEVVLAGDSSRKPRLDADDEIATGGDDFLRRGDGDAVDVHQLPVGEDARPCDVEQDADPIGRAFGCVNNLIDAVHALRSGIDQRRHTV